MDLKLNNYLNIVFINTLGTINADHNFNIDNLVKNEAKLAIVNSFINSISIFLGFKTTIMDNILNHDYSKIDMLLLNNLDIMHAINFYFVNLFNLLNIYLNSFYDFRSNELLINNIEMNQVQVYIYLGIMLFCNKLDDYKYNSENKTLRVRLFYETYNVDYRNIKSFYDLSINTSTGFFGSLKDKEFSEANLGFLLSNIETGHLQHKKIIICLN